MDGIKKKPLFSKAHEYFFKGCNEDKNSNLDRSNIQESNSYALSDIIREQMITQIIQLRDLFYETEDIELTKLNKFERKEFYNFLNSFSKCPLCGAKNHKKDLIRYFFDKEQDKMKAKLREIRKNSKKLSKKVKLSSGILCCTCYKKVFD